MEQGVFLKTSREEPGPTEEVPLTDSGTTEGQWKPYSVTRLRHISKLQFQYALHQKPLIGILFNNASQRTCFKIAHILGCFYLELRLTTDTAASTISTYFNLYCTYVRALTGLHIQQPQLALFYYIYTFQQGTRFSRRRGAPNHTLVERGDRHHLSR